MDTVPLVMMAATKSAKRQGQELYKEMQKRGWDVRDAVMASPLTSWTPPRRLLPAQWCAESGWLPEKQIYKVPTNPTISRRFRRRELYAGQHRRSKHWLVVGMNDNTVLGGVRATEGRASSA